MTILLNLLAIAVCGVVQNFAFTAVSRSRNSADVRDHMIWSIASNGLWFVTQVLLFSTAWNSLISGSWAVVVLTGVVYVASTTSGSVVAMVWRLKTETGKQRVGAR